jgi:hypothetical protein
MALVIFAMPASFQLLAQAQEKERPMEHPTFYRTTRIDGLSIFYREAGPKHAPDLWTDEFAFLNQPGQADIQSDLFYDYRTNVDAYPKWQDEIAALVRGFLGSPR